MRKAKYSAKQVCLPNASLIGYGTYYAKPGYWVTFKRGDESRIGRVLGRIDKTARDGLENCDGWLAVMMLGCDATHAFVQWVNPVDVTTCREDPPAALLAWITGAEWPSRASEIPRMIAMADYGTCSEYYVEARNDPAKPYNARREYASQFAIE